MPSSGKINVFYSYAREDERYRAQLVAALSALRREGVISEWHDRMIKPGGNWDRDIRNNLEKAHVVLFLISPDFMKSDYCKSVEVKRAVELHWERRCRIVPIIVHPAESWTTSDFGSFQALPRDAKAISTWDNPKAAFEDIVEGIRVVCNDVVDWENPIRRSAIGDWIEIEQTISAQGQRVVSRGRSEITDRTSNFATCTTTVVTGGQTQRVSLNFPLDGPILDSLGAIFKQFGENLPPNAVFSRQELGRGDQKLIVGGNAYNCQWVATKGTWEMGDGSDVLMTAKTWRCIDVPIDGVVKEEWSYRSASGQEFSRTSKILIAFGRR